MAYKNDQVDHLIADGVAVKYDLSDIPC